MNHVLKLYVAADTPHSARAVASVKELCETHLKDCHELEVIDIIENPELAEQDVILAVPTLIKKAPPPARRLGNQRRGDRLSGHKFLEAIREQRECRVAKR
jgi:circadian clock protein KaiB